ncbi:MAG TPA: YdcH family protein [Alphaproteobacteria bacterium]|nr:YdcH family protein [Alphaproteobacteria bacterium]
MALEQRIEALMKKHHDIDAQLLAEESRPLPDDLVLHHLKSMKLHLKDEMSRLQGGHERQAA